MSRHSNCQRTAGVLLLVKQSELLYTYPFQCLWPPLECANTDGGEILVGVARDGSVAGVEDTEAEMEKIGVIFFC